MRRDTSIKSLPEVRVKESSTNKPRSQLEFEEYIPGLVAPQSEDPFRGHPAPHCYDLDMRKTFFHNSMPGWGDRLEC